MGRIYKIRASMMKPCIKPLFILSRTHAASQKVDKTFIEITSKKMETTLANALPLNFTNKP